MDITTPKSPTQAPKSPTSASLQEKDLTQPSDSKTSSPSFQNIASNPFLRPDKVENALIASKQATQNKISLMQIKKHKEIQESLRSAPNINQISKLITSCSGKSFQSPKSTYVQSLVYSAKVHKLQKLLSRGLVYRARICLDMLDLRPSHCKSPLVYKISKSNTTSESLHKRMLENYYSRDKNRRLFDVKAYKSEKKIGKAQKNSSGARKEGENEGSSRKEVQERSELFTLSPELSPKVKGSGVSFGFKSLDTNYSQWCNSTKGGSPVAELSRRNLSPEPESGFSISLSPHRKKIGFRAGINLKEFKEKAVPMRRYLPSDPYYYWNRVLRELLFR